MIEHTFDIRFRASNFFRTYVRCFSAGRFRRPFPTYATVGYATVGYATVGYDTVGIILGYPAGIILGYFLRYRNLRFRR